MDIYKDLCNIGTELPTMKPEGVQAKAAPAKKGKALESPLTRDQALELLKKYNNDPFHVRHALTVEGVMRWYAENLSHLRRSSRTRNSQQVAAVMSSQMAQQSLDGNLTSFLKKQFQQCSLAKLA